MTTGGTAALVRRPEGSARATLLELLFDVVFVAALAMVSTLIAERESWTGAAEVLLTLTAIWWTWSITSTTTEFYDPDQRPIQVILMVAMVGSVGMAAALPMLSAGHALVFAIAYVTTHVVRGIVLTTSLHRQRHQEAMERAARFLFWFVVSGVFWVTGALTGAPDWRLWSVAIAIDLIAAAVRYPTPWLGQVPIEQYDRTTGHLAERYQQFIILALGDIILVPTLEVSRNQFDRFRLTALFCAFAIMLLLWQVYVFRANQFRLAGTEARQASRLAPYTHLVMLAGVIGTATSFDLVVAQPTGATPVRWLMLIVGGPLLFVLGRTLFTWLVTNNVPWRRLAWQLPALLVLPWAGGWPPLLVTVVVAVGLAGHILTPGAGRETKPGLERRRTDD
ncbi:low temperature requirement protein A [Micromonospora sp. U21]|uniref:low temperature requirement protein A n=1 Tax=Micromonospora sp. U21 TaxID=2824899 RepID=UPI001B35C73F|nr:low temperature requirement protein A [Micromonospora sp. U21]MBQ0900985.1 low temperature requirement protein A [Micromonospora sp. U21]